MIGKCLISALQAGVATGKRVSLSVVNLSGSGDESPGSFLGPELVAALACIYIIC